MIQINNLTAIRADKSFLKKIIQKVLIKECADLPKKNFELSVALITEEKIKFFNKRYRKKNKVTDVLSFSYLKEKKAEEKPIFSNFSDFGEIIICLSEVKKNAKESGVCFKKELARVLIHGILHALGYNHEKNKKAAELMKLKENSYLLEFFQI